MPSLAIRAIAVSGVRLAARVWPIALKISGASVELEDCKQAAAVRRRAIELSMNRSMEGLPMSGMDYSKVLDQCCEMVIGYVHIPIGEAGPKLLDGFQYTVPMATTEGCLVASTNRGCKAILQSGGAQTVVTRDGMTRAPAVRFESAKRAADLKWFLEDPNNFDTLSVVFNRYGAFSRGPFCHFLIFFCQLYVVVCSCILPIFSWWVSSEFRHDLFMLEM